MKYSPIHIRPAIFWTSLLSASILLSIFFSGTGGGIPSLICLIFSFLIFILITIDYFAIRTPDGRGDDQISFGFHEFRFKYIFTPYGKFHISMRLIKDTWNKEIKTPHVLLYEDHFFYSQIIDILPYQNLEKLKDSINLQLKIYLANKKNKIDKINSQIKTPKMDVKNWSGATSVAEDREEKLNSIL